MNTDFDIAIIGAGLIGLGLGRTFAQRGLSTLVVELHKAIATETSARNSGVIHAGLYYPQESLKAQLCVRGRRHLYDYAAARNIPHRKTGKLIVSDDTSALTTLLKQGERNGVEGLTMCDAASHEPTLKNHYALYSAESGVIDAHAFAYALAADFESAGGTLVLGTAIQRLTPHTLHTQSGDKVSARHIINAAGLHAHTLAQNTEGLASQHIPPIHYAKGVWCRVRRPAPFTHLIYPLPPQTGLGVHLTLGLDGTARLGPDSTFVNQPEYTVPDDAPARFAAAVQSWWPGLTPHDLLPDQAGIRPRLAGPGQSFADFRLDGPPVHCLSWLTNLSGIESPGLTATLALADYVAEKVQAAL